MSVLSKSLLFFGIAVISMGMVVMSKRELNRLDGSGTAGQQRINGLSSC